MNRKTIGFYDYTVILTYCALISACMGIISAINHSFSRAVIFLIISGICDMFDGTVASTKDRTPAEKKFGIQIDSLSDLVSFGVMPAVFVYCITGQNKACNLVVCLYVLAALIRLAYYNVTEEERQQQTSERRSVYLGLPVTVISILLPLVYTLFRFHVLNTAAIFPILLFITGGAFITPVEIKKPAYICKFCSAVCEAFSRK